MADCTNRKLLLDSELLSSVDVLQLNIKNNAGKQWSAIYSTSEVKHKYANMQISMMLMLLFNVCDYNKQRALLKTPSLIEMLQAMNNSF